jgi:hypothetical protein
MSHYDGFDERKMNQTMIVEPAKDMMNIRETPQRYAKSAISGKSKRSV